MMESKNRAPIAALPSGIENPIDFEDDSDMIIGGCSVSPIRSSELDRVSETSSKSQESLTSMSSVEQQHRPRSATTVSNSSSGSHFLRPKSLAISSGFKIWRKDRGSRYSHSNPVEVYGTSCPTGSAAVTARKRSSRKFIPEIHYDFASAPSTPRSEHFLESKHNFVSTSDLHPDNDSNSTKKSGSRLSLNITPTSGEKGRNPSPSSSRSPKLLSRFLRNSFVKVLSLRGGNGTLEDEDDQKCSGSEGTGSYGKDELQSPEITAHYSPCTPSTKAYIEETRLIGLPVIPFEYPTCVLVEKMKNRTRERERQSSGGYKSSEPVETPKSALPKAQVGDEEDWFFDPAAHSPLENLVDIAQQELTEEETLFGLYDDTHQSSNSVTGGSVGSACSALDFYYSDLETNKKKTSNLNNNNNNNDTCPRDTLHSSGGEFYMADELSLCDPTKSSWRRDHLVPLAMPVIGKCVSGPYLDMTHSNTTHRQHRSKAVPIGKQFSESPKGSPQYSNPKLSTRR